MVRLRFGYMIIGSHVCLSGWSVSSLKLKPYSSLFPIVWHGKLCSLITRMIVMMPVMANFAQLTTSQALC